MSKVFWKALTQLIFPSKLVTFINTNEKLLHCRSQTLGAKNEFCYFVKCL